MNKGELIEKISNDAGISKTQAGAALDSFITATMGTLKKGDKVTLVGFGTYSVTKRAARMGHTDEDRVYTTTDLAPGETLRVGTP